MTDTQGSWYTVVIPAYNASRWIVEAIGSAASQDPAPAEIVVIDDGSTDDTASRAEALPNVRVVRQPNGGEAAARNAGLRAARTRWVSFLDADDVFLPDRHRHIAAYLAAHPDHEIVATDTILESGGKAMGSLYGVPFVRFATTDQRTAILERNFLVSHVVCDRERLLALGGFDESLSHACDWDMWIRFVLAEGHIGLVDIPLSAYRRHDSAMTSDPARVVRGDIAVWTKTRANPELTPGEREGIDRRLVEATALLAREQLKARLLARDPNVRRLALDVVRSSTQSPATRAKATSVVLWPAASRRLFRRREQQA
jgi:glycosyltransferase involved in cell wall biosynthesis